MLAFFSPSPLFLFFQNIFMFLVSILRRFFHTLYSSRPPTKHTHSNRNSYWIAFVAFPISFDYNCSAFSLNRTLCVCRYLRLEIISHKSVVVSFFFSLVGLIMGWWCILLCAWTALAAQFIYLVIIWLLISRWARPFFSILLLCVVFWLGSA